MRECQGHPAGDRILSFGDQVLFASPTLSRWAGRIKHPTTHDQNPVEQDDGYVPTPAERSKGHTGLASMSVLLPNGSRLSSGRNARGRKEVERQTKRLASRATQFFPTCERPAASSAC